ncbi:MAG: polyphosphate kinase 2 family protein [Defluviitaleaceae bacterium]|nr:polyphosphate kinase 2 family protein [Defluviitaleaceae bacterium]
MSINKYKVTSGKNFKLENYETVPGGSPVFDKTNRAEVLIRNRDEIRALQSRLYADGKAALLVLFQGMDGGGKDSAIRNVIGVMPQGVMVHSFKQPSTEELAHDYLWRAVKVLPERGMIAIFNRSYYEDVLVVKVHELYKNLNILERCKDEKTIERRCNQIKNFENYLWENGILTVKIFMHLSLDEQRKRFLKRIEREDKNWKFSGTDMKERGHWPKYQAAFEYAIASTSTEKNPWWIVPADRKPYTHAVVSQIILEKLKEIDPHYPSVSEQQLKVLADSKDILLKQAE